MAYPQIDNYSPLDGPFLSLHLTLLSLPACFTEELMALVLGTETFLDLGGTGWLDKSTDLSFLVVFLRWRVSMVAFGVEVE